MSEKERCIGILTSGGDCPGMNPAIRAVVLAAREHGLRTLGIREGYRGFCAGDWFPLTADYVEGIGHLGGTVLRSARYEAFKEFGVRARAIAQAKLAGIEGLIVIGGDGSFAGARDLSEEGLPCVGLPGTIDNDIVCTDYTIGYDTALNTVMQLGDMIGCTAASHDRCLVVEVMGNMAGDLTLYGGTACGAAAVLLLEETNFLEEKVWDEKQGKKVLRFIPNPEEVARLNEFVIKRVLTAKAAGQKHFLVFVAEGITFKKDAYKGLRYPGGVDAMAEAIQKATGVESRAQVLGYTQRGGVPTARDRILASRMGGYAVRLLSEGKQNLVVIERKGEIESLDIDEALRQQKEKEKLCGVQLEGYLSESDRALARRLSVANEIHTGEGA